MMRNKNRWKQVAGIAAAAALAAVLAGCGQAEEAGRQNGGVQTEAAEVGSAAAGVAADGGAAGWRNLSRATVFLKCRW